MGGKELGGGTVEVSQEGAVTEVVQLVADNRNSKEIPTERTDTLSERSAGGLPATSHDGEAMRPGTETRDESDVMGRERGVETLKCGQIAKGGCKTPVSGKTAVGVSGSCSELSRDTITEGVGETVKDRRGTGA